MMQHLLQDPCSMCLYVCQHELKAGHTSTQVLCTLHALCRLKMSMRKFLELSRESEVQRLHSCKYAQESLQTPCFLYCPACIHMPAPCCSNLSALSCLRRLPSSERWAMGDAEVQREEHDISGEAYRARRPGRQHLPSPRCARFPMHRCDL